MAGARRYERTHVDTPTVVAALALAGTAITGYFTWRSSTKATDVSDRAEDRAWVKEIKQDAVDARKEVEELRRQVRTLSSQIDAMAKEADYWINQYQLVHRTAWRPGMSLDRLRELIGPEPPATPATR